MSACSLGLAWSSSGGLDLGLGYGYNYSPGFCSTSYDYDGYAYTECTGGYSFGLQYRYEEGATPSGASLEARVFLALTAAAVVVGYRRRDRRLVVAAPVLMFAGLVVTGLNPGPGMVAYVLGFGALLYGLHLDGAIRLAGRTGTRPTI